MAQRVEDVVNEILVEGSSTYRVRVPPNHSEVQVVLDRTRFEAASDLDPMQEVVRVEITSGRNYIGGVTFGDDRIEGSKAPRPGQRMLWSFGRWPLPRVATIDVSVRAIRGFNCLMHVDFLD